MDWGHTGGGKVDGPPQAQNHGPSQPAASLRPWHSAATSEPGTGGGGEGVAISPGCQTLIPVGTCLRLWRDAHVKPSLPHETLSNSREVSLTLNTPPFGQIMKMICPKMIENDAAFTSSLLSRQHGASFSQESSLPNPTLSSNETDLRPLQCFPQAYSFFPLTNLLAKLLCFR